MQFDPARPIYLQVMEEIKKRTVRGEYTPGGRLPSVRELAREIGVNPNTVARVYLELEREGFIDTRRGQGSYVTDDTARIERERNLLADDAAARFIAEVQSIALTNGHRQNLVDFIKRHMHEDKDTE